ncbi:MULTISPECIES: glutathione synthase [Thalassobaculum]|uniref:Glutathione synthetase n=1 Tax=Thalassobaculum litoreum DSM 18839 TaxID=1123362 RepID=A0A8G2BK15_9PROT|nr:MULTISPECIES: glutathione synthase [Thalassobaculum]SDF73775.1 glutathione synthase [Thalassobaculum litoreum DSM 18839]
MGLEVAIQMDPIEPVNIDADSTFALALEAKKRGHTLYHYLPKHLSFRDGRVTARAAELDVRRVMGDHFTLGERGVMNLADVDVVLMRQDPPFDMSYITATHVLEHIHPKTLVVNDPAHVRNAPEKLFVTHFEDVMPPTLITHDPEEIKAFRDEHKDIIVKPLFGNGGAGVFHIKPGDENLNSLLEIFTQMFREPIIVQTYLPEVRQGDKRVILVDGKGVGAINRIPADGEARSNMHVGGRAVKCEMTRRDHEICEIIGPELKKRGQIFVGIDVIGRYLTEINVTSPTGIQELSRFDGIDVPAMLWDAIEEKL